MEKGEKCDINKKKKKKDCWSSLFLYMTLALMRFAHETLFHICNQLSQLKLSTL